MTKTMFVLTVVCLVPALVISGCHKAKTAAPPVTTVPALSAAEIISKSYDAMQGLNSFHFLLDQTGGSTPIALGIEMTKAEGDIVRPDKMQMTMSGTVANMAIDVKLITSGAETFMTNPLSGNWEALPPQFQVLSVFDPDTGIVTIIKDITAPALLNDELVDNTLCYHLKGNIASENLLPLTGNAASGVVIAADVWIGKNDFLVRQVKLDGKITAGEKDGIVRTLTLTNFNKEVTINLPQ